MPSCYYCIVMGDLAKKAYEAIDSETHAKDLGHVRRDQTDGKYRDVNNCFTGNPKAVGAQGKTVVGNGPNEFLVGAREYRAIMENFMSPSYTM